MALTHFRNKQKIIAWVIAVPLIATFTLFGLSPESMNSGNADMLSVAGETISSSEFYDFRSRLQTVNPSVRLSRDGREQLMQIGNLMYRLKIARDIGMKVSDEEIGSYTLKNPFFHDSKTKKFDQKLFKERLADNFKMNVTQYRTAVEEHLLLDKFDKALDSTATVSPLEVYNVWAMDEAKVTYDAVSVKISDYKEKAAQSIKDIEKEMTDYAVENAGKYEMRKKGFFQLEYIMSRFSAMPAVKPEAAELKKYFMENKDDYKDKSFEKVKSSIEKKLIDENRQSAAARKIKTEVDTLVAEISADYEIVSAQVIMDLLKKSGIKGIESGVSGKELLTIDKLEKHALLGSCPELADMLKDIDSIEDKAEQDKKIAVLKANFNERVNEKNLANKIGVFKVRITDYRPGQALDIKTDAAFRKMVKDIIIDKKAAELAENAIEEMRTAVLDGKTEGLKFEKKTEKLSKVRDLSGADINIDEPTLAEKTADEFSLKVLRSRAIPSYAEFSQLPTDKREQFKRRAVMFSRGFSAGRYGYIPGNRFRLWSLEGGKANPVKILIKMEAEKDDHEGHDH
ncbi:MAG: SurA N-terminal domain-containing protein [Planctomycetota bacterium]|jgi:hypothetical protein